MTYSCVLAFGDSTTAGCELIPNSVEWEDTKKLSFPNSLANHLGIECINYAWPGGSNDRSLRLLPEALLTHPNSLVLFTYTNFDRTEIFVDNPDYPQEGGYTGLGSCWSVIKTINEHKRINELYLRDFYTDTSAHNRYKSYNMMLQVQLLCERYAKNYMQIFLYDGLLLPPDYQQQVFGAVDKKHIYKFDYATNVHWKRNNEGFGSLQNWAKHKQYPSCPGGHIGQEAHNNFAMEVYNTL
jgi:hypothetical protein